MGVMVFGKVQKRAPLVGFASHLPLFVDHVLACTRTQSGVSVWASTSPQDVQTVQIAVLNSGIHSDPLCCSRLECLLTSAQQDQWRLEGLVGNAVLNLHGGVEDSFSSGSIIELLAGKHPAEYVGLNKGKSTPDS